MNNINIKRLKNTFTVCEKNPEFDCVNTESFHYMRNDGIKLKLTLIFDERKAIIVVKKYDEYLCFMEIDCFDSVQFVDEKKIEIIGVVKNKSKTKVLLDLDGNCLLEINCGI